MLPNTRSTPDEKKIAEIEAINPRDRSWQDVRDLRFARLSIAARQALKLEPKENKE